MGTDNDDTGRDDEGGGDSAGSAPDRESLRELVREVVADVLADHGEGDAGDEGTTERPEPAGRGQAAVEHDFEGKVSQVISKLRKDEERDKRLAEVEQKQKLMERPPVKQSRLERVFWGPRS